MRNLPNLDVMSVETAELSKAGFFLPKLYQIGFAVSIAMISGCTTSIIGSSPSADPPALIPVTGVTVTGEASLTWDRPSAFGPVPIDKRATGDAACLMARPDLEAIGYHPNAKDQNGKPLESGGFYCAVKLNGDRPDIRPPQLVRAGIGMLRWDRPRAFGRVPEDLQEHGDELCAKASPNFVAYGYHPWARDLQGKGIAGGGFFCGPSAKQAEVKEPATPVAPAEPTAQEPTPEETQPNAEEEHPIP